MEYSYKNKNFGKKISARSIILVVIIVLFIIGGFFIYKNATEKKDDNKATASFVQPTIDYPDGWVELSLNEQERQTGVALKASRNDPSVILVVSTKAINVSKDYDIKDLPSKLAAKLKEETPGFKLVSKKVITAGKYDAVQVRYTQSSLHEKEATLIIFPTTSTTYYLTFVNDKDEYNQVKDQIQEVANTYAAYIAGQQP